MEKKWNEINLKINPLIEVHYNKLISKSNRIKALFESDNKLYWNKIVGNKFSKNDKKNHITTHCISKNCLRKSIENIEEAIKILDIKFKDEEKSSINYEKIIFISDRKNYTFFNKKNERAISRSKFIDILVDSFYVDKFDFPNNDISETNNSSIVSLYDTGQQKPLDLLKDLSIDVNIMNSIDSTTFLLDSNQKKLLLEKAPFLIAMSVSDLSEYTIDKSLDNNKDEEELTIKDPDNEPIIGVIDTLFDEKAYFNKWVEHKIIGRDEINTSDIDSKRHGTQVTSLIVDGPRLNPQLEDGCGNFRVKLFSLKLNGFYSSFQIIKEIKEIVLNNQDIKVWNLSLGSNNEINDNFISIEGAELDRIQHETDTIFVISGTNARNNDKKPIKIGSPADSINSLVVNSVNSKNEPVSYARSGPVLELFKKPDVACFGGDENDFINVWSLSGKQYTKGTSFAAPWIARKLGYLIYKLGFDRESAKALIIDSAINWSQENNKHKKLDNLIGHGVVPTHINDIIQTKPDEIKFIIRDVSEKYKAYNYDIYIPKDENETQPFVARATLCYFSKCSRNMGVDYTNTELDIQFGRIKFDEKNKAKILTINDNKQDSDDSIGTFRR
ncbi:S8 family peptidase [Mycoplasma bradburyae]|uniref:S8 family peptidase n=1 Tax=Mycoplasma bradburyae TaxID=2963128 RepID=UPI00234183B1|nr:S8 family peptidase [Mycoplasma bradburyae]MDC4182780.1 S8 family peptidase [Mycoplasma bradburyae]